MFNGGRERVAGQFFLSKVSSCRCGPFLPGCKSTKADFACAKVLLQMTVLHLMNLWEDPTTSDQVTARRSLPLKSPNIHELRRRGAEIFLFCMKVNKWKSPQLHEWPLTVTVQMNKNQEVIKKPEYEHKRRDVPMKVSILTVALAFV